MAKYTIELSEIVQNGHNIFSFPYTFYDDSKKEEFQKHFINHFYFKEIGTETVGRFEHYLEVKFNEVLPYYNMLFESTTIKYEKVKNYNLTETFERDNTHKNKVVGTVIGSGDTSNTTEREENGSHEQSSSSNLESTTDRTGGSISNKDQTSNDTVKMNKDSTRKTDIANIGSDTPQGLLAMTDIKNKVYASKADISDNNETVKDIEDNISLRTDKTEDIVTNNSTDNVNATSTDSQEGSNENNITETSTGSSSNNVTNNQDVDGLETEKYTKNMSGSYGVITEADMIVKHIELQKILTTIETKFFTECEDLFMQLY